MKKIFISVICVITAIDFATAQQGKKTEQQKVLSQTDINKMIEDAMKEEGMSKDEQEQTKKITKDLMPGLMEQNTNTANYPEFTDNKQLVSRKNAVRISSIPGKTLTKTKMAVLDDKKAFSEYSQKIMQLVEEMDNTPTVLSDIEQNGLQLSVNSGLQAPGTFNLPKTLFQ